MSSFSPCDPDSQAAAIATAGRVSEERQSALLIIEQAMKQEKLKRLHELVSKDKATPKEIKETSEIFNLFYEIHLHGNHVYEDMANKSSPRKPGDKIQIEAFTDNETILEAVILSVLPPRREGEWMFRVEYNIPAGRNKGRVVNKAIYESEIIDEVNE